MKKRDLLVSIAIAAVGMAGLASIPTPEPSAAFKPCPEGTKTVYYAQSVACYDDDNHMISLKATATINRPSTIVQTPASACFDAAKTTEQRQACDRLERK